MTSNFVNGWHTAALPAVISCNRTRVRHQLTTRSISGSRCRVQHQLDLQWSLTSVPADCRSPSSHSTHCNSSPNLSTNSSSAHAFQRTVATTVPGRFLTTNMGYPFDLVLEHASSSIVAATASSMDFGLRRFTPKDTCVRLLRARCSPASSCRSGYA